MKEKISITKETILDLCEATKINLSDKEIEKYYKELNIILSYFDEVLSFIEEKEEKIEINEIGFREDKINKKESEKIKENFAEKEEDLLVAPSMLH